MKKSSKIRICFALLIGLAILCRLIPMPAGIYGITPMYAMAIFSGTIFREDKKYGFLLPILSFFLCDVLIQVLYATGNWSTPGFYEGQLTNYILFALLPFIGFMIRNPRVANILAASIVAPTVFFILSNLAVWAFSGFYPITMGGLKACYIAGWPFYFPYSLLSTLVFSGVLFGGYAFWKAQFKQNPQVQSVHSVDDRY